MGFYGEVIFYSTERNDDWRALLERVIRALQLDDIRVWRGRAQPPGVVIQHATRWRAPDDSWARWQRDHSGSNRPAESASEFLDGPMTCDGLLSQYVAGGRLVAQCNRSHLATPVSAAIEAMPADIRDGFCPSDFPVITLGWHDIIDGDHDRPYLVDRAFFAVALCNPGAPNDWRAARDQILALPALRNFRASIEQAVGPMKTWVLWS